MDTDKIIYPLERGSDKEAALKSTANDILAKLKDRFGHEYEVKANEFGTFDKDWSHEIKVRKGNKVGAEVEFKWEESSPDVVTLEVDESTKMGSWLTYGILLPFVAAGAYMGYNDMAPLEFLPGQKIAGGLGGLIALVPGIILLSVAKSSLLKSARAQNAQLLGEVRQAVSR